MFWLKEKWHGITYGSWAPSNAGERCSSLFFFVFSPHLDGSLHTLTHRSSALESLTPIVVLRIASSIRVFHGSLGSHCFHKKIEWNVRQVSDCRCLRYTLTDRPTDRQTGQLPRTCFSRILRKYSLGDYVCDIEKCAELSHLDMGRALY